MSDELDPLIPSAQGIGLRRSTDRRCGERRTTDRGGSGRRRAERRRARLRTLLLAAAALATAHTARTKPIATQFNVSVSMDAFRAVPASHAYDDLIDEAAWRYQLDPELIRAVMRTESAFNPTVVSPVGALGLMQLMPELAQEMGVVDPFDPRQNIMGGARYLRQLLTAHKGSVPLTLASYNAGPTAVARFKAIPPFAETRQYVKRVTGLMADAHAANDD